jgi:hypothetical protein
MPAKTRTGYGMRKVTVANTPISARPLNPRVAIQRSREGASSKRMKRNAGSSGGAAASLPVADFMARKLPASPGRSTVCRSAGSQ